MEGAGAQPMTEEAEDGPQEQPAEPAVDPVDETHNSNPISSKEQSEKDKEETIDGSEEEFKFRCGQSHSQNQ